MAQSSSATPSPSSSKCVKNNQRSVKNDFSLKIIYLVNTLTQEKYVIAVFDNSTEFTSYSFMRFCSRKNNFVTSSLNFFFFYVLSLRPTTYEILGARLPHGTNILLLSKGRKNIFHVLLELMPYTANILQSLLVLINCMYFWTFYQRNYSLKCRVLRLSSHRSRCLFHLQRPL